MLGIVIISVYKNNAFKSDLILVLLVLEWPTMSFLTNVYKSM